MPTDVLREYFQHDPEVEGFTPRIKHWLLTSSKPFVQRWVDRLRVWSAKQLEDAIREQVRMSEIARELYHDSTRGKIRHKAVIHPLIMHHMRKIDGREVWNDPTAIADTQRHQPKLFINN